MNFDQIVDAWKSQDEVPFYQLNKDLLQLVLRQEQDDIRRQLRREQWLTYVGGAGMTAVGAFFLWAFFYFDGPLTYTLGAAVGTAVVVLWVIAFWISLRRQRERERRFGNTLREEIARNVSLIDYQLSRHGRWLSATLWSAPALVAAGLLYWFAVEANLEPGESRWDHGWILIILVWAVFLPTQASSRAVRKKLEPRRDRLRELLTSIDASE